MTRVLSVDQGTKISGYAIFQNEQLIASGILKGNEKYGTRMRMYDMVEQISNLIDEYRPDILVLEEPFAKVNLHVFEVLCELFGILGYVAHKKEVSLATYSAAVWRAEIELKGKQRAEQKAKAIEFVKTIFNMDCSEDESEAILIGYSHLHRTKGEKDEQRLDWK